MQNGPPGAGESDGAAVQVCAACAKEYGPDVRFCALHGATLRPRSAAPSDSIIGRVIDSRYHVQSKIGEGGMGKVYLAEHLRTQRRSAIKVISRDLSNDSDAVGRFGREAMNASRISHPHVAAVYDFGETEDGLLYLALEYVEGETLSKLLEREGALPPARAVEIARQVVEGLGAAHYLGIVHRDLKPSNIIISRDRGGVDLVKVVDFGIAKASGEEQQLTRTGFVIGTPEYMSPEQLIGDPADPRSDIYSLGCILYEMLTGEHAFGGAAAQVITRRLTESPPRPRAKHPDIPKPLDEIVVRALGRTPVERFQTMEAFGDALLAAPTQPVATGPRKLGAWLGLGGLRNASTAESATPDLSELEEPAPSAWIPGAVGEAPPITPPGSGASSVAPVPTPGLAVPAASAAPALPGQTASTPLPSAKEHTFRSDDGETAPSSSDGASPVRRAGALYFTVAAGLAGLLITSVALAHLQTDVSAPEAVLPPLNMSGAEPPVTTEGAPVAGSGKIPGVHDVSVREPEDQSPEPPVIEDVVDKTEAPSSAELRLAGLPARARVELNGKVFSGRTLSLRPGQLYVIEVTAPGFTPVRWRGSLSAGARQTWSPEMRSLPRTEEPRQATRPEPQPVARPQAPSQPAAPRGVPDDVISALRKELARAEVEHDQREFASAIRRLRAVSTRLTILASEYSNSEEIRTLAESARSRLGSVQRKCRAAHSVAVSLGEQPPVCE